MNWTMQTVYIGCAAVGGTVLALQTLMLFIGGGDHSDVDVAHADMGHGESGEIHGHDTAFGLLSLRTGAAFLTFFGLAGWGGTVSGWGTFTSVAVALGSGTVMLFGVAYLFSLQRRLYSAGNLDPKNAVGRSARVYLRIPGQNGGKGKITVAVQGRTVEFAATTSGEALATGSEVRIVRQLTEETFEVEPLK